MVPTLRVTGLNVQIVNGTGSTDVKNGAGNLVLGYNELGNLFGDDRTGSHCLVYGTKATYSATSCLVGGSQNSVHGYYSAILTGDQNVIDPGVFMGVIGTGFRNDIHGPGAGFIVSGTDNDLSSASGAIVGGIGNNASEGAAIVIGGGQANAATGNASVVSGGTARAATGNGSWAGGNFFSPN